MRSTTPQGVLMRSWLIGAGLALEHDVLITSLVKCSTGGAFATRIKPDDLATCSRFRRVEDAAYPPSLIITVGKEPFEILTGGTYSDRPAEVAVVNGVNLFPVESPGWATASATNRNAFFARASYLRRWLIGAGLIQGV